MESIVSFCNKTIEETAIKINDTDSILKPQVQKKEHKTNKQTNIKYSSNKKKKLHQRKFKKYNCLKYKPNCETESEKYCSKNW